MAYRGNAEAVVFNPAPIINFFQQEQERKRLENQAIDKQIADDISKYTPDGLRQQDIPQFLNQYQNLKNLSIQYRDAIRNPAKNPKMYSEYQNAKSKLTGLIAESKAAKENTKSLYDFRAKNLDKLDDDAFKQAMVLYNAPVGSMEHDQAKNFDQSQLVFKAPKMDLAKLYAPLSQIKPEEVQTVESLPTGQFRKVRTKQVPPGAIAQYMASAYDTDLLNSKKGFNDMFANTPDEQKMLLEDYAKKYYDPNFQIKTPKDLAVATGLYGRANKSTVNDVGGSPYLANQAFQREQQARSFAHSEKMAADVAARKDKGDYLWENDIAKSMQTGDTRNVRRLATELESSTPGVERVFLKDGETTQGALRIFRRQLKANGLDGKTKNLNDADFKSGVLVVAVPKTNKDGERIKNKVGKDVYEYLAVSSRDPYLQNRLNKLKNYAVGGTVKPLTDKIYQQQQAAPSVPIFTPDELSPLNDEEQ
jgi:hypothetical protein